MSRITIYSTGTCPICDKTKTLLNKWKITYQEKRVDQDHGALKEMLEISSSQKVLVVTDRSVPAEKLIHVVDQIRLAGAKDVGVVTDAEAG